jgi:hypothetical protein
MIRVKLPKKFEAESTISFFQGVEFTLMGRTFSMCAVKDQTVILLWVTQESLSLLKFWNWHNPFSDNMRQGIGKWASRFDLGFSATVPSELLSQDHIHFIGDFGMNDG